MQRGGGEIVSVAGCRLQVMTNLPYGNGYSTRTPAANAEQLLTFNLQPFPCSPRAPLVPVSSTLDSGLGASLATPRTPDGKGETRILNIDKKGLPIR